MIFFKWHYTLQFVKVALLTIKPTLLFEAPFQRKEELYIVIYPPPFGIKFGSLMWKILRVCGMEFKAHKASFLWHLLSLWMRATRDLSSLWCDLKEDTNLCVMRAIGRHQSLCDVSYYLSVTQAIGRSSFL